MPTTTATDATRPAAPAPVAPPSPLAGLRPPAPLDADPTEAWPGLHRRLVSLLSHPPNSASDFHNRLGFIESRLQQLLLQQPDDSLFVLVQMLFDPLYGYSASHALLCALTCQMISPHAQLDEAEQRAVVRAALTMNMGMHRLQDTLARQHSPASAAQREEIRQHPRRSAALLRDWGVDDPLWLGLVEDHHETPDGQGYPSGKATLGTAQQLLQLSDRFVARISPRKTRRGQAPSLAVGKLYQQTRAHNNPLGALFAKQLGMYPPGTYVRLHNQETALVVRRGERVHMPVVVAIADPTGMPFTTPSRRDTQLPAYAIQGTVPAEEVKIRLDLSRLLRRL